MTPSAQELRQIIAQAIPQDKLVLKPGEHHVYNHVDTGRDFVSVTTKLSIVHDDGLDDWRMNRALEYLFEHHEKITDKNKADFFAEAKEQHRIFLESASSVGTLIHGYADQYFSEWIRTGNKPDALGFLDGSRGRKEKNYAAWSGLRALESWVNKVAYEPLGSELKVWSEKYGIAGTLDDIGLIKGKITLVDLKTSNRFKNTYHLQLPPYGKCFEELTGLKIEDYIIVKLHKANATATTERVPDPDKRFEEAMMAFRLFDAMEEIKKNRSESRKNKGIIL